MPLLLCPNDNSSMTTVTRAGVQFDMCPVCRGVWLDRGELEKLMASTAEDAAGPDQHPGAGQRQPMPPPPPQYSDRGYGERGEHGERGERGERGEYGYHGGYRKKRSIFDIFD